MKISIIAAVAHNGVIGRNGDLPWHIPEDLKRFADLTRGHTVIVGRKTHESIVKKLGGPLKNRTTIVLSRNRNYGNVEGSVVSAQALEGALWLASSRGETEVFVIGGAEVYREALPLANRLYLTLVHDYPEGDTSFPPFQDGSWQAPTAELHPSDTEEHPGFTFFTYERKTKPAPVSS